MASLKDASVSEFEGKGNGICPLWETLRSELLLLLLPPSLGTPYDLIVGDVAPGPNATWAVSLTSEVSGKEIHDHLNHNDK